MNHKTFFIYQYILSYFIKMLASFFLVANPAYDKLTEIKQDLQYVVVYTATILF